jgi:N-methylhydantoinase A/oxoprolinase/acetone carboxylase beta subunit
LAPAQKIAGPAIVESAMTTVLLRPGDHAMVTGNGWLDIAIEKNPIHQREERRRDDGYR